MTVSLSPALPRNLNRAVCLEERPLFLDAGRRAERLRFRRMIFAGRNGILNNGGTPRKGASALHTTCRGYHEHCNCIQVHGLNSGEKIGDCGLSQRERGTKPRFASFTLKAILQQQSVDQ